MPIIIAITLVILIIYTGWIGLVCFSILVAYFYLMNFFTRYLPKILKRKMIYADKRNKLINNTISGIKSIKFNAYEDFIKNELNSLR